MNDARSQVDQTIWQAHAEQLTRVRAERGYTLQQISEHLHLRLSTLENIEQGNWHLLPAGAYGIGYLMQYARTLRLDPKPFQQALEAPAILEQAGIDTRPWWKRLSLPRG
jgi:cytoskeletal protein RodZ